MRRVIGVDPGPTPGLVVLDIDDDRLAAVGVMQCSAPLLYTLVETFNPERTALVAVERFVTRGRTNAAQQLTRDQVANLARLHTAVEATAAQVKPWATDTRLEAVGLLAACSGMRHARDAARHALFAAVRHAGLPDPLSNHSHPKDPS